jgi:hypothetical protein
MATSSKRSQPTYPHNLVELQKFETLQTRMYHAKWSARIPLRGSLLVPLIMQRWGHGEVLFNPERSTLRVMISNGLPQATLSDSSPSMWEKIQVMSAS